MKTPAKLVLLTLAVCGVAIAIRHAQTQVAVPKDMPANAKFLQSGFAIENNEPEGNWIACRLDAASGTDWCRVTDAKGMVVYQGDFLPVSSSQPVSEADLTVAAANPKKIWVKGPVEELPVPAIPLTNGSVLVPAADRYALLQRWNADSSEYDAVRSATP